MFEFFTKNRCDECGAKIVNGRCSQCGKRFKTDASPVQPRQVVPDFSRQPQTNNAFSDPQAANLLTKGARSIQKLVDQIAEPRAGSNVGGRAWWIRQDVCIFMLLFFWPVGLLIMWKYRFFSEKARMLITICTLLYFVATIL